MSCASHGYGAPAADETLARRLTPLAPGGSFVLSLFDKAWRPGLSVEEAVELCDKGIAEIRSRLSVAPPSYVIKIVDKDGGRVLHERRSAEVINSS